MRIIMILMLPLSLFFSCSETVDSIPDPIRNEDIIGFGLLEDLKGHWVGTNETSFGFFDWFAFDFRPISASHLHSIYEGGTNNNIITSIFIADFEGRQQIMARNGGWLGNQYRATYFVLDESQVNGDTKYYRLVDAVGRENRAYMEFSFRNDSLIFEAYKDNSGSVDVPFKHMGFKGTNYNPSFAQAATELFSFPQKVSEVNFQNQFANLIDPDSALFLEEDQDPFPKSSHGHISDLIIDIDKTNSIADQQLLLYISSEPLVSNNGAVDLNALNSKVVRTIDILADELRFISTYLHPDTYYITAFSDLDQNFYPSTGDYSNASKMITVTPESELSMTIDVNLQIP